MWRRLDCGVAFVYPALGLTFTEPSSALIFTEPSPDGLWESGGRMARKFAFE